MVKMKIIKILELEKYKDTEKFKEIEDGIYQNLDGDDKDYFEISLLAELENLEEPENTQYPLEDLLDSIYCHTSYSELTGDSNFSFNIVGDDIEEIKKIKDIVGKRVYNKVEGEYVDLVIE